MDWNEYKEKVASSRELIVHPFFRRILSGLDGIGLDIGCGDGDITAEVAQQASGLVVGIDLDDVQISKAKERQLRNVHFREGDVSKSAILSTGLKYDYAFSNCCFPHLSDSDVHKTLLDLHASLKEDGLFVCLVPSLSWAKEMYSSVVHIGSGITAIPRYGDRQWFRLPEWYAAVLARCGFEIVSQEEIVIPDVEGLDRRYRDKIGHSMFSSFVAKRVKLSPEALDERRKAFEIAHDNRKFEIGLFWQRSLFFWGFVGAALVGYGTSYGKNSLLSVAFGLFGFVCSFAWALANRGSKYWQEYWEGQVNAYQHFATGDIFIDHTPKKSSAWDHFGPRRYSVSKLAMALSDYVLVLWVVLIVSALDLSPCWSTFGEILQYALIGVTVCYCVYFAKNSNSED